MLKKLLVSFHFVHFLFDYFWHSNRQASFKFTKSACSPVCTVLLRTWNKKRKIEEILRENKGERRVALRNEEKDPSCEPNAFIGLDGYSGSRGIEGKGGGGERSRKWGDEERRRNRSEIEMHCGQDGRRRKINPVSGNAGDQLSGEGQDSCRCQEFSSRVPVPDEDVNPSEDGTSTYATSLDFDASFFRCSRKNNGVTA